MKKTFNLFRVLPVALVLSLTVALAQDETYVESDQTDQTTYEAPEADTVVYDEPTAYYASVVYQSAVIYNAPVYYIAAGCGHGGKLRRAGSSAARGAGLDGRRRGRKRRHVHLHQFPAE